MDNNDIVGIIYSLRENNYDYLKKRKSPIYIKYIPHADSKNPTKLCKGHRLFFYISGKEKTIAGYSKIRKVAFCLPEEIRQNYMDRIQMTSDEFITYVSQRDSKSLLTLELENIIELQNEVRVPYPITMGGKYLSSNAVKNLLGNHFIFR